jgi:hypothetical protein
MNSAGITRLKLRSSQRGVGDVSILITSCVKGDTVFQANDKYVDSQNVGARHGVQNLR